MTTVIWMKVSREVGYRTLTFFGTSEEPSIWYISYVAGTPSKSCWEFTVLLNSCWSVEGKIRSPHSLYLKDTAVQIPNIRHPSPSSPDSKCTRVAKTWKLQERRTTSKLALKNVKWRVLKSELINVYIRSVQLVISKPVHVSTSIAATPVENMASLGALKPRNFSIPFCIGSET